MKTVVAAFCGVVLISGNAGAGGAAITAVTQKPWIVREGEVLKSETELVADCGQPFDGWVKISVPGKPDCIDAIGSLPAGRSPHVVHVPELARDGEIVTFALYDHASADGAPLCTKAVAQQKIRHWRLYVGHNSHLDIGYTDHQEFLKTKKWPGFWDQALLKDMPDSDTWPDESKVRLEVEGIYQLDTSLPVRTADWFETLRARLAERRFAYGAAFANNAMSNWGAEELARSAYFADRFFRDKTGVGSTRNVIMRDEPSLSWGAIDALVEAGARSFSIHHNSDHNPWRGTTVYPELFYAQGRNPANRLLVWNSPVANYCVDELNFRGTDVANVMARISDKLMGYQNSGTYAPSRAADGVIGKTDEGEWASGGEQNPWLRLAWTGTRTIDKVCLYDRFNGLDNANAGTLTFSDGSTVAVDAIPGNGGVKEVTFPARKTSWVRFAVTAGSGPNVGLSEIQVYEAARNIAPEADVTASSAFGMSCNAYPYDVAMVNFTHGGDNCPMSAQVYRNIKAINDKGYAFPRVINANYDQFFDDVVEHWSNEIPKFKGTIEDWWNFGAASTAYETGLNRANHDKLAAAETLATMASLFAKGFRYPCEALAGAYENMMLYDEHTWGSPSPAVDDQWRWKRNTAIASDAASTKVLADATAALNALIPTSGKTLVVHNSLTWPRSDVVTIASSRLPAHFALTDAETGTEIAHQQVGDGTTVFVAANVPGLGYRTFKVTARESDPAPAPAAGVTATARSLENLFYKITFDAAGNITSILDKQNGNAEMVDGSAGYPLNQYVIFKEGALAGKTDSASVAAEVGPVMATVTADGATTGLDRLRRRVVLYGTLPRIDIINEAVKGQQIANVEIGYFSFPLRVDNFMLRHEMPTGDMQPGVSRDINDPNTEQYSTSSTAFYTVNRWVDASDRSKWGITFASLDAPLLSYGQPDMGASKGSWNVNYNATKPWIYSMAFNNEWQTNFQKTQPGRAVFRYSLRGHAGGTWQAGNAETFGAEVNSPLRASVIADNQRGGSLKEPAAPFLGIAQRNVVLTTAKMAEANGEGVILRFNEIRGQATQADVDLRLLAPSSVVETDLVENDKAPIAVRDGAITLSLEPFGFRTVRVLRGSAPQTPGSVAAAFNDKGCLVAWADQDGAACYEVFRGTDPSFKPGSGSYLATVSVNRYFDGTVKTGLTRKYYYAVRTVQPGRKSAYSATVPSTEGLPADTTTPSAPVLSGEVLHPTKITLTWLPSADNHAVKGYRVFRDGAQVADLAECMNSWMDNSIAPGSEHKYTVNAYDVAGNISPDSNAISLKADLASVGATVPLAAP